MCPREGVKFKVRQPSRCFGVVTANVISWRGDVEAWLISQGAAFSLVCVQGHQLTASHDAVARRLAWAGWRSH